MLQTESLARGAENFNTENRRHCKTWSVALRQSKMTNRQAPIAYYFFGNRDPAISSTKRATASNDYSLNRHLAVWHNRMGHREPNVKLLEGCARASTLPATENKIHRLRDDNGRENIAGKLQRLLKDEGIRWSIQDNN
jgi:hypothetical protein